VRELIRGGEDHPAEQIYYGIFVYSSNIVIVIIVVLVLITELTPILLITSIVIIPIIVISLDVAFIIELTCCRCRAKYLRSFHGDCH
jgi:hypothetical protein